MVPPGLRAPRCSASRIIERAMRSYKVSAGIVIKLTLMLPPMLNFSTFAHITQLALFVQEDDILRRGTIGVFPMSSVATEAFIMLLY